MKIRVRNAVTYVVLFLLNAALWWYFRNYLNVIFGIGMIFALAGSAVLVRYYAQNLLVKIDCPKNQVRRDSEFTIKINIVATIGWCFIPIKMHYSIKNSFLNIKEENDLSGCIFPAKGLNETFKVSSKYCGMLEVELDNLQVCDYFGAFYYDCANKRKSHVIVFPDSKEFEAENAATIIADFAWDEENQKRGSDYNPDYELREYIPGDELKNVHWKLSAKQDKLMIRERLSSGKPRVNIVLEFGMDKMENDALMDSFYTVCNVLLEKEYPLMIYWWNVTAKSMESVFIIEEGELERLICEILGMHSMESQSKVRELYELEHKREPYILIKTGECKGAYIR